MQTAKKESPKMKAKGMVKAEAVMNDIVTLLNREGVTVKDLAEKHGMTGAYITAIAGMMRKSGVDIPFQRKGSFYKAILEQWKKEKPELFTNYGLKRKVS